MHRSIPTFGAVMLFVALVASPAAAQQPAVIDGWGTLKFGMSIAEAKAASDIAWDPTTCANQQDIALKGCDLLADRGPQYGDGAPGDCGRYKVTIDGMRFRPQANFDRWGRLESIHLDFDEDVGGISACLPYFQRTMDNLERRYGRFASRQVTLSKEATEAGYTLQEHATSAGSPYFVHMNKTTMSFSSMMESDLALHTASGLSGPMRKNTRAYIMSTLSMFGTADPKVRPLCGIGISYEAAHMPAPLPAGDNKIDF